MIYQKLLYGVKPYHLELSEWSNFELHCHPEVELSYCVKGSYKIVIDGNEYTQTMGDLAVIKPMSPHELKNNGCECLYLTIEMGPVLLGEEFNSFVCANWESCILKLKNQSDNPVYKELVSLLDQTAESEKEKIPFSNLVSKGNIYKISAILLRLITENVGSKTSVKSLADMEKIGQAVNEIYSHYDKPISLDEVSRICGYSKSNFCKTFKAITGESFHSMLNRHRIDIACMYLKETMLSVEDIALSVGFADSKSFCRVFKKIMGKNTGEYRKGC